MDKRGILLKQIIEILIAVAIVVIIIIAAQRFFATYFGNQKDMQAKGTLDKITQILGNLTEAETKRYVLQSPGGWYIVAFDAQHNENNKFAKPQKYVNQNLLCICDKKCSICQTIALPLMHNETLAFVKIGLSDIWLTNAKTYYNISKVKATVSSTLTEQEKTEISLKTTTTNQAITNNNYQPAIDSAVSKYYPEVKEYIANQQEFAKIIKAIIAIESQGVWNAVGRDGEVGLMQLMPQTADALGLKIYDPDNKFTGQGWNFVDSQYSQTSYYNSLKTLASSKTKAELIVIDERFDETKNIDAATKHLVSYIKQFQDYELAIIAFNAGGGGVTNNCRPQVITACNVNFDGYKYFQKVKTAMESA